MPFPSPTPQHKHTATHMNQRGISTEGPAPSARPASVPALQVPTPRTKAASVTPHLPTYTHCRSMPSNLPAWSWWQWHISQRTSMQTLLKLRTHTPPLHLLNLPPPACSWPEPVQSGATSLAVCKQLEQRPALPYPRKRER